MSETEMVNTVTDDELCDLVREYREYYKKRQGVRPANRGG